MTGPFLASDVADFRTRDGVRIHYRDEGRGDPTVFLHGWSMSHRFFDAQVQGLAGERRCIAPDVRGCGDSTTRPGSNTMDRFAEDVAELIDHLKLERVTLVGWSMGGGVTMRYIDRHGSGRLAAVALVDFPPRFREDPAITEKVVARLQTDREKFITSFLKRMVADATPETVAWMKAEHDRVELETAIESYRQLGVGDATGATYDLPALLAFPEQGWYKSALDDWKTIFPRHVVPTFPKSRHCPFLEEPAAFAQGLRELEVLAATPAGSVQGA